MFYLITVSVGAEAAFLLTDERHECNVKLEFQKKSF